jgi:predicted component of type VI protein secretion system
MSALIIYEPRRATRVFILRKARSLIGSSVENDETIRCKGVEPHHLTVEVRGDGFVAADKTGKGIDSKAGRVAELALVEGTEFMVGAARVRFDAAYTHDGDDTGAKPAFAGSTALMTRVGKGKDTDMVGMLVFRGGERKVFEIGADPAQIGSDAVNPICVPEKHVSGRHARIFQRNGAYWIIDLDSTNGTLVDGVTVKEARLQDCIPVTFGKTKAVFRLKRAGQGRAAVPVFFGMGEFWTESKTFPRLPTTC